MTAWIISASALILVVTALRFLLKGKIFLRLQYALWGLVLLRLLVPFSIGESRFSIMNAVTQRQTQSYVIEDVLPVPNLDGQTDEPSVSIAAPAQSAEPGADAAPADAAGLQLDQVLQGIWITGTAVAAGIFLYSNLRFAVRLRRSRQRVEQEQTTLPVYVSNAVETPCLFGLFRPAIYVTPEVLANPIALRHVLAHETTHYRHGDPVWALLRCVCLALHWYNPLVWLAAVLSRRDGELPATRAPSGVSGKGSAWNTAAP